MTFEERALAACVVFSVACFALNWIRFVATLIAFGLFLLALVTL